MQNSYVNPVESQPTVSPGAGGGRHNELASSDDDDLMQSLPPDSSGAQEQIDFVKRLTDKYLKKA